VLLKQLLQIANKGLGNHILVHHLVLQSVGRLLLDVEKLEGAIELLRLRVGAYDRCNHGLVRFFEILLLILVVHNVDVRGVHAEVRVRVVPAHDFKASLLDERVRLHLRLRAHFCVVIPLFLSN